MSTSQDQPTLSWLRHEALAGRLSRRDALKRGAALGLSAPVVAALLAACGSSSDSTATTGAGGAPPLPPVCRVARRRPRPRRLAPVPPAARRPAARPLAARPAPLPVPGHGRGKADLLRILYWQAPTILNVHSRRAPRTQPRPASCSSR